MHPKGWLPSLFAPPKIIGGDPPYPLPKLTPTGPSSPQELAAPGVPDKLPPFGQDLPAAPLLFVPSHVGGLPCDPPTQFGVTPPPNSLSHTPPPKKNPMSLRSARAGTRTRDSQRPPPRCLIWTRRLRPPPLGHAPYANTTLQKAPGHALYANRALRCGLATPPRSATPPWPIEGDGFASPRLLC